MAAPLVCIVCYDISEDRRRTAIYKLLRGYGEHIQYSVFRCVLSEVQRAELSACLESMVDDDTDQVLLIPIGPADRDDSWNSIAFGRSLPREDRVVWIL